MKKIKYFLDKAAKLGKEAFIEEMDFPFLVYLGEVKKNPEKTHDKETSNLDVHSVQKFLFRDDTPLTLMEIFPVVNKGRGKFEGEITVGRGENNDVVINLPLLSRSHAVISRDNHSTDLYLKDLGSRNKTYLNWETLPAQEWAALNDGDSIIFSGQYGFTFCSAEKLFAMLKIIGKRLEQS